MIYLNFSLSNPFAKGDWQNVKCWSTLVSKHKAVEAEVLKDNQGLIDLSFRATMRRDHAGAEIGIGLWKYSILLKFYDIRHWNYENNCWEKCE